MWKLPVIRSIKLFVAKQCAFNLNYCEYCVEKIDENNFIIYGNGELNNFIFHEIFVFPFNLWVLFYGFNDAEINIYLLIIISFHVVWAKFVFVFIWFRTFCTKFAFVCSKLNSIKKLRMKWILLGRTQLDNVINSVKYPWAVLFAKAYNVCQ